MAFKLANNAIGQVVEVHLVPAFEVFAVKSLNQFFGRQYVVELIDELLFSWHQRDYAVGRYSRG